VTSTRRHTNTSTAAPCELRCCQLLRHRSAHPKARHLSCQLHCRTPNRSQTSCTAVSTQHTPVRLQPRRLKMARIFLRWCRARRCAPRQCSSCTARHCAPATSEDGSMAMHVQRIGAVARLMPTQADHHPESAIPGSLSPRPPDGAAPAAAAAAGRHSASQRPTSRKLREGGAFVELRLRLTA